LQHIILIVQEEYGPDSFLPSFMLKSKFNYFVPMNPKNGKKQLKSAESSPLNTKNDEEKNINNQESWTNSVKYWK